MYISVSSARNTYCISIVVIIIFFFQLNTGQFNSSFAGADHRIQRAWIQGLTGCGVTVAVVDDGKRNPNHIENIY